jgi:NADH dehydrogenase
MQWKALFQGSSGDLTGFMAWVLWRGAYLTKSMSWKNKLLIPVYVSLSLPFSRPLFFKKRKDEPGLARLRD